jgi:ABC-type branched-subunit amino acid transport system substrate-binding protein
VKRASGWFLGLLAIASMGGGGWFALRRTLIAETVTVVLMRTGNSEPTLKALARGAAAALEERGGRAGRFKVRLHEADPDTPLPEKSISWIGTSEAMMLKGDFQPTPLKVAAFDVHPWRSLGACSLSVTLPQLGDLAAAWAKKSNAARVLLVREPGYLRSTAIADRFVAEAGRLGLTLLADRSSAEPDLTEQILSARPDLVFFSGEEAPYGTAEKIFGPLRAKGFAGPLVMAEADPEVSFLATRPDLVEGCYLITPFAPAPADVAARIGTGPHVTAGYFAMKAVLDTLERADSSDEEELRSAAARVPNLDRPCASYVARSNRFRFVEELKWQRLPVPD